MHLILVCLQGRWMIHGGAGYLDESGGSDEACNPLHVYDFTSGSWLAHTISLEELDFRRSHMVACHNDALVVLGGTAACGGACLLASSSCLEGNAPFVVSNNY